MSADNRRLSSFNWSRRDLLRSSGGLVAGGLALSAWAPSPGLAKPVEPPATPGAPVTAPGGGASPAIAGGTLGPISADPTAIPGPIDRTAPADIEVALEARQVEAEIEPGVKFMYMTFSGQVPGPMIRVRQGDRVHFSLTNKPGGAFLHNIDFHAVYGTGGGNAATTVAPGETRHILFEARYPGAFIYHCAVPNLDLHISSGMFGMIVVEPPEGLPEVSREFYLGQHEVYTDKPAGEPGVHRIDFDKMAAEQPNYVLLQGEKHALTAQVRGAMQAKVGETARIFIVNGGPNLVSSFHPIGNVWTRAWRDGALATPPDRYVQTALIPPGSCGVFDLDFPVPETVKLVDHALSRVVHKGMLGEIEVTGDPNPQIFDPHPAGIAH